MMTKKLNPIFFYIFISCILILSFSKFITTQHDDTCYLYRMTRPLSLLSFSIQHPLNLYRDSFVHVFRLMRCWLHCLNKYSPLYRHEEYFDRKSHQINEIPSWAPNFIFIVLDSKNCIKMKFEQ